MLVMAVLPAVLILTGMVVFTTMVMVQSLRQESEEGLRRLADRVAGEIERGNTRAVLTTKVMAEAQQAGMFGRRVESSRYARRILAEFPEFTGAYFGYEPDADQGDSGSLAADLPTDVAAGLDAAGRFLPYWFRDQDDPGRLVLEPLHDMESSLYYAGCRDLFAEHGRPMPMVTEPYVYGGKMIVEYTYPVLLDGRFVGIAGVDRALDDIDVFLESIRDREGVDVFLLSGAHRFVAATTDAATPDERDLKTRSVMESPYRELYEALIDPDGSSLERRSDPLDARDYYFASARVPTGGWRVVLRKSEESILGPIRTKLVSLLSIAGAVLLLVCGLALWVSSRTGARVRQAVEVADRLAEGDLSTEMAGEAGRHQDEVGRLAESFNHLVNSSRRIAEICVAISAGDFTQRAPQRSQADVLAGAINHMAAERGKAEEQLRSARVEADAANQAKSAFLASMSHELRTPMNAIIGYSEMLIEESEDLGQDEFIPDLKRIHGAGKHLLALINDILDLSKIESGKMELFPEVFDINEMLDDVVSTVETLVKKKQNTLAEHRGEGLGSMETDLTKVRQSLFNLISNAAKFTEQGMITLSTERVGSGVEERVRFDVRDTGIGIAPEKQGEIFAEFSQADASTTRNYGGTGLGLSITKRFCEMMGGEISLESEPGRGSVFSIVLPVRVESAAEVSPVAASSTTSSQDRAPSGSRGRILVIDDDPSARDLLGRMLRKDGFDVVEASGGEEGLRLARELRPAAITLDVIMPGRDGWSVLRALKDDPETASIPVIIVSLLGEGRLGYALGATEFVSKPIDRTNLLNLLGRLVPDTSSGTLLVVDDDDETRSLVRRALEKTNRTVEEAANGREALDRVRARPPRLILLDLMMPVMDGFDFVHELRKTERWRDIPVVVMTAMDLDAEDRRRLGGKVQGILQKKDHGVDELLEHIRHVVASTSP